MEASFFILGFDASSNPTGPVGKKTWDNRRAAEDHAVEVLKTQHGSSKFLIVETVSVVQRTSPPIEVLHLDCEDPGERRAA